MSFQDRGIGSVRAAILAAAARLREAGVPSPRTDAELLAAYALGVGRGRLLLVDAFSEGQAAGFAALVDRRARREPLQHLLGSAYAGGIDLAVGPGVFVPRPETDLLIAWGLACRLPPDPLVVDLCSGSGAIALAVAAARPAARVYAVERDPAALVWLRRNADARAAAGDRSIEILAGDATDPALTGALDGRVDLLLCNPPYVPDGSPVPVEVSDFDPPVAVFGGPDGLDVVRGVVARAAVLLAPGGRVGIEHDDSHETAVVSLLAGAGLRDPALHRDLAGRPRFSTAHAAP